MNRTLPGQQLGPACHQGAVGLVVLFSLMCLQGPELYPWISQVALSMYVSTCDSASTISPGCLELVRLLSRSCVSPPLLRIPALFALVLRSSPPPVASSLQRWSSHPCCQMHTFPKVLRWLWGHYWFWQVPSLLQTVWKMHCVCGRPDEFLVTLKTFIYLICEKQCILQPSGW